VDEQIQSWDCSFKDLKTSDFVAGHLWGRLGADAFLLDRVHGRMDVVRTLDAVRALSRRWPGALAKLIEEAANGIAVIQMLAHEIPGVLPVKPLSGKVARARSVTPLIAAGNVYLPHPAFAPWVQGFIEEHSSFPNGRNDDDVDALTQALARLSAMPLVGVPTDDDDEGPVEFPG
jgi:predicted phage terminase large subunit-like protein